jgi:predicted XRE-type DNA-binding protein
MDNRIIQGSGDIFRDLGFDEHEAQELRARGRCVDAIKVIREREGWTQKQLGERVGMAQSEVSALLAGKISRFSLDRLLSVLVAIGVGVRISLAEDIAGGRLVVEDLAAPAKSASKPKAAAAIAEPAAATAADAPRAKRAKA